MNDAYYATLGRIVLGEMTALVVWPRLGDAVGIDLPDGTRKGIVAGLDTAHPRLVPDPLCRCSIGRRERERVLDAVAEVWRASCAVHR
jgi:hypothetical protein